MNRLYYGDNLDVLRRHVEDASVDLVYLDPPSIPTRVSVGQTRTASDHHC
jgi:16S rRNA G966 N2-methylase RsmD